jgi:hypothetical protein
MTKKLSPKQIFLLLYLLTGAGILTPFLLMNLDVLRLLYGLPLFLLPFIIIFATFFVVVAIPRARIALRRLEIPGKYSPKHFLLLLWLTAQAFLLGVVLHNGFYGLGMIAGHITPLSYLLEGLHVAFFIIAIPIAPAGIVVGAIGKVWEWCVVKPIEEMKAKGIQLPTTWPYFAPIRCYAWLWKFGKGVEAITDRRIRAAGVFAAVFFLGIIGFVIIRAIIQRRLARVAA